MEDMHLLYSLQFWLSGRGMRVFFRDSSAVTVVYTEQVCIYIQMMH